MMKARLKSYSLDRRIKIAQKQHMEGRKQRKQNFSETTTGKANKMQAIEGQSYYLVFKFSIFLHSDWSITLAAFSLSAAMITISYVLVSFSLHCCLFLSGHVVGQ